MKRLAVLSKALLSIFYVFPLQASPDFFNSYDPKVISISAPFKRIIKRRFEPYYYEAQLTYQNDKGEKITEAIEIKVRGAGTLSHCKFPKFKIRFADHQMIRLNTHCQDEVDAKNPEALLADAKSPHREAFIYRWLQTLGIESYKARPLILTYLDTDDGSALTRNAFFLEDKQARGLLPNKRNPVLRREDLYDPEQLAQMFFAQILIGNTDWEMITKEDGRKIWASHNLESYQRADGTNFIVLNDFNAAGAVVGYPSHMHAEDWMATKSRQASASFSRDVLDKTREFYSARFDILQRTLDSASFYYFDSQQNRTMADTNAKILLQEHLDLFRRIML
jgi:hypothetical protein